MAHPPRFDLKAAFSSLENHNYKVLWWGGLYSFISVQAQFLLRGILAWDLTESEGALGLVYLVFGLSMLVATPLGGVAADRYPKRTVLLISQFSIMAAAISMGVVVITDVVQFWMLMAAAGVQGAAFGFLGPARVAFSSELVGREQLGNAISLSLLSMNGTRVFAPALAGILAGVAFVGIGGAYLLAGLASSISFLYLLRLPRTPAVSSKKGNPFGEIAAGISYVKGNPPVRRIVVSSFFVIMFAFNYLAFTPALVKGIFDLGDGWVGIMSTASAIGAVLVSVPIAALADGPRARPLMVWSGLAFGAGVIALAGSPNIGICLAVAVFIGAATTTYQSLSNTLALTASDDAMQGRVQSLMQLAFAGYGIAAAPLGALAVVIGLRWAMAIMGFIGVLAMLAYALFEHLDDSRQLSRNVIETVAESHRPFTSQIR